MSSLIQAIPEGMARGWALLVNGEVVPSVSLMQLVHEKFGTLTYGKSPGGNYDQWGFHEVGGGGSVIVPFVRSRKFYCDLMVGVVQQKRPFQNNSQPVLNLPRGFMDPKETHLESAVREYREEVRVESVARVVLLEGEPANPNSTFLETWGEGEGIRFYAIELMDDEVVMHPESQVFSISGELVKPVSKSAEGIMKSEFIPWYEALRLGDMMTLAGVSRLIAHLAKRKELLVSLA